MQSKFVKQIILSFLISVTCISGIASQDYFILPTENKIVTHEFNVLYLEKDSLNATEVWNLENEFKKIGTSVIPAYKFGKHKTIWVYAVFKNQNKKNQFQILFENNTIDLIEEYVFNEKLSKLERTAKLGQKLPYHQRQIDHPEFIFEFEIDPNSSLKVLYKLQNVEMQAVPIHVGTKKHIEQIMNKKNLFNGIFAGIFLVMFFYNLVLYLSTGYKIYAYYTIYVFSIGFGLFTWSGLSFKYFWPNFPWLSQRSFIFFLSTTAIAAMMFIREFLLTKTLNSNFDKLFRLFIVGYFFVILLQFIDLTLAQNLVNILGLSVIIILVYSANLVLQGNKQARIYLIAWALYLIGIIVFFLREFALINHTHFSFYLVHYGSAAEVTLLSLALGNRINSLRKEKRELIKKQNSILEEKVVIRTKELELTLSELKEAQTQLVEAEKMASLGQLTAGVAHEINNPINFVSSNIQPLKLDIDDLYTVISELEKLAIEGNELNTSKIKEIKEKFDFEFTVNEIESLVSGIKNGADRTAEIVKKLRTFSNLDQNDLRETDIHECLNSTLMLLNTKLKNVEIIKNYGKLSSINTLQGELNQVFMNILDNAIYACHKKDYIHNETPKIKLTTLQFNGMIQIKIYDNGIGMSDETVKKIYEPFFTNKPTGEGTGLGMYIVHGILQKLNGELNFETKKGLGTEITLTLKEI